MCLEETFVERTRETNTLAAPYSEKRIRRELQWREREGWGELEKSEQEEGKKKENNKFSARQS